MHISSYFRPGPCIIVSCLLALTGCTANLKTLELSSLPDLSLKRETPAPVLKAPLREMRSVIPASGQIIVQASDTVYRLAARYRVTPQSIIEENNLESPYNLQEGLKIRLTAPRTHIVNEGDTLYSLSQRYAVSQFQLVELNGLSEPYQLSEGQALAIPDTHDFTVLDGFALENAPKDTQVLYARPVISTSSQALEKPAKRFVTPSIQGVGFTWPLSGEIVTEFGPAGKGVHNDGVNISAPAGSPVTAAAPGTVAYIGRNLKTFGTLVLVKHEGGLITAYAHLEGLSVAEGQVLQLGDLIGQVGMTGRVTSPQLHFEIRKSRTPVNPRDVIS